MARKIVMLVGFPGSGKSTYLNGLLNAPTHNDLKDAVVLSTDRFIESVAENTGETYNLVFKENIKLAEAQLRRFRHADDVCHRRPNASRNRRAGRPHRRSRSRNPQSAMTSLTDR